MEEKKDQQLTKKVRFDLNEEVFLIPSKWDRLSKCKTTNARIIDAMAGKHKTRTALDRRIDVKGKQNRNRKTQNLSTYGKRDSNPELNGKLSDNGRPNSTPNVKTNSARKTARYKEGNENTNSGNSTLPVEGRLKFYHRPPQELPKLDLVLPKIPYTPDLKKAIEKALQRSRSRPTLESGLNNTTLATQKNNSELSTPLPKEKCEGLFQRRLSDSSIRIGDEKPIEKKENQVMPSEAKFSELSSNLDGWSPFSAWSSKDSTLRSNSTAPITRGRSMSSLIPSSILY
ncbi:hypothetical protein ACROYT_G023662 [Oculina patagonica]